MSKLVLTEAQIAQIGREGSAAYPNESCGAIIGVERDGRRVVERLEAMANSFDEVEKFHRFKLNPLDLARIEKLAGSEGKLVLGLYHSHPDHPARPSEYDRTHAWPFYSYVIVSIQKGSPTDITSWQLDEATEQFVSESIINGENHAA
jgi:proteasome lid subunit RPN8/RPN11